ncbi:hypothetical protein B0H17DRAFT_314806 [Mycena rosella]|uniref:Uncharacterized protein n=1 Tax=Mycena rosella TaxID=1033263 RepID=A0AAD7CX29_MYCRO|nr:hypothetical protein B0H17DRAFT_314806 [Mycena rosella]
MWKERFRLSTALYIGCRYALIANALSPRYSGQAGVYGATPGTKLSGPSVFWGALLSLFRRLSVTIGKIRLIYVSHSRLSHADLRRVWEKNLGSRVHESRGPRRYCPGHLTSLTHVPGMRCVGSSSLPMSPEMVSILMVIFESSSAFLTTTRCVMAFREGGRMKNQGIMFILFEQGILYFCTISVFTTAAVILNYRPPPGFFQRLPNAFTLPSIYHALPT